MISFVLPAYNAEKTIKRALDSIFNQEKTGLEYEVIVVNDGSTDNIAETMKLYKQNLTEENKTKLKYFEKPENSGLADTRNYGVNKALGKYIIFVDSDDYISKTLLKDIEQYVNSDVDLIKWSPIWVDEQEKGIKKPEIVSFEVRTGEDGFNKLFGKDNLIDCVWDYAIKKEIMLEFPSGTYHEDFAVMSLIILNAKTMVSINKHEYYYVQSQNSIMRNNDIKKTRKKIEDKLQHYDNIIKQSNLLNVKDETKENLRIFAVNSLLVVVNELDMENKKWFKQELKKRKIAKNIKIRNIKQLIKKIILEIEY